jgi:hypothetical protein
MSATPPNLPPKTDAVSGCVTRAVAAVLAEEPTLEAVTIDRSHKKISVATLGRTDVERLTQRVAAKVRRGAFAAEFVPYRVRALFHQVAQ